MPVREVHVALRFPVACTQPVVVSFVVASGDPSCLSPDAQGLRVGPAAFDLAAPAPGDYDFALEMPDNVGLSGDAFLCVNLATEGGAECTSIATRPQLPTTNTCASCGSWNLWPGGSQDLCSVLLPGRPVMYAVFESCAVPVLHPTWGEMKLRYR